MAGFFKQLAFRLSGGIPRTEKYEARIAAQKKHKGAEHWQQILEEEFRGSALDKHRWDDKPGITEGALELLYSASAENQVFTDGFNVNVQEGVLSITTMREAARGLGFDPMVGFIPVERDYTSGIVTSAPGFKLQYGKIEAKISFSAAGKHVYHAMWLGSGKREPHVNVLRIGHKLELSAFAGGKQKVETWGSGLLKPNTDYIVSLEWTEQSMVWRINGAKMFSAANMVDEQLFINFSSGVFGNPELHEPVTLNVKWVKAYKHSD